MKNPIRIILTFFVLSCSAIVQAQKENNVWIFADKLGINFNTSPPSLYSGSLLKCYECCASVCDKSGKLLFYTNGLKVWDNTNTVMPNGSGLLGCDGGLIYPVASATMGAAIVPILGYPDLYYLFTLQEQELYSMSPPRYNGELRYSIIDMKLNGGKGDVVSGKKNILLDSQMSERMTVVKADCGAWLITHHNDKNTFYAYKINSKDSIHSRVVSDFSTISYARQYTVGQLKSSPNGKFIACSTNGINTIELFDFDNTTGILTDLKLIESGRPSSYSVEFSEDNSKFYTVGFSGYIAQYDLSLLPSVPAVRASQYILDPVNRFNSLRLAPDGKIYTQGFNSNQISVINFPNNAGAACSLVVNEPSLKNSNTSAYASFGNKTINLDDNTAIVSKMDTSICDTNKIEIIAPPLHFGFLWNDGDTSRVKIINSTGTYWRRSYYKCLSTTDTFVITFTSKIQKQTKLDTVICEGESILLDIDTSFKKVIWNDGDTSRKRSIGTAGIYYRKSEKNCTVFTDTFKIKVNGISYGNFLHDTTACFLNEIEISSPWSGESYLWNDGTTGVNNTLKNKETKWVVTRNSKYCWIKIDTFKLTSINFEQNLKDTFICKNQTIELDAKIPLQAQYKWSNGGIMPTLSTNKAGVYWVNISIGQCNKTDTVAIFSKALNLQLGEDIILCEKDSVLLDSKIDNAQYLWNTGATTKQLMVKESGEYTLIVRDEYCTEKDEIVLNTQRCDNCISIPNAFTPNNDGRNDQFKPIINCPTEQYELLIVNRYGEVIFRTTNPQDVWNGQHKNQDEELGVYYYLIKIRFTYPGAKDELLKGDISLLR